MSLTDLNYFIWVTVMQPIATVGLSPWVPGVFSLIVYFLVVAVLIGVLLFLSAWLGEKKPNAEKARAYESGIIPTGTARLRYPVPFYLVAIFFLIFDVEGCLHFRLGRGLGGPGLERLAADIVFHHRALTGSVLYLA